MFRVIKRNRVIVFVLFLWFAFFFFLGKFHFENGIIGGRSGDVGGGVGGGVGGLSGDVGGGVGGLSGDVGGLSGDDRSLSGDVGGGVGGLSSDISGDISGRKGNDVSGQNRRFFLDLGANTATSVELFRSTYPEGNEYFIYSFEIAPLLCHYLAGYPRHKVFCPLAVGTKSIPIFAQVQLIFSPNETTEVRWGGGTVENNISLPWQLRKIKIPSIDISAWIKKTFKPEDELILKIDIEGSEYPVLHALIDTGAYRLVDKWYGELHRWCNVATPKEWKALDDKLIKNGIRVWDWIGEIWYYEDMNNLNPPPDFPMAPGYPGQLLNSCKSEKDQKSVALGVAVGLSPKRAQVMVNRLRAYFNDRKDALNNKPKLFNVTLFLYSDFVELYPRIVAEWARQFPIASRGEVPFLNWNHRHLNSRGKSLITAGKTFASHGLSPHLLLTDAWNVSKELLDQAKLRGLRVVRPTIVFPPLHPDSPYKVNTSYSCIVGRTKIALSLIEKELRAAGGIVVLDADEEDAQRASLFLVEYLQSAFNFVTLDDCF